MKDCTLKILLGIIAVNLTIQTVKDIGLFPTAYAQTDDIQVYNLSPYCEIVVPFVAGPRTKRKEELIYIGQQISKSGTATKTITISSGKPTRQ